MDTALSEIMVFKLFRAETATGTVTTPAIVITLDIIKHRCPHYFPTAKAFPVDTFASAAPDNPLNSIDHHGPYEQ